MTDKPVWLLDVDGVVNAFDPRWEREPLHQDVVDEHGRTFLICWAPELLERIRALIDAEAVEVRWASTWCGWTEGLERAFGLPALPSAFAVPDGRYVGDVKLAAVRAVLAEGRRLIWTDDMETPEVGPLFDELTADGRAFPSAVQGLCPEDMDAIEAFCGLPS
jgi:hypothetical protein